MTNTSEPVSISAHQGDRESWLVEVEDDLGAPINLTGATFLGQIRKDYGGAVVGTFTFENTDLLNGKFTAVLSQVTSAALPVVKFRTSFVFDFQYTIASVNETPVYGYLVMQREVSI